jgi:predicted dehydrogenase
MKIGIVGVGYWGSKLSRVFSGILGEENVKHYDVNGGSHVVGAFPEEGEVDAVAIATPIGTHLDLGMKAIQSGFDVLVEKPMTCGYNAAHLLVSTAEKHDKVLMVDHTYLFHPGLKACMDVIKSGKIGELRHISLCRRNSGRTAPHNGVLWDLGPHDISIAMHIMGGIPKVRSCIRMFGPEAPKAKHLDKANNSVIDELHAILQLKPVTASVELSWAAIDRVREVRILGSEGLIVFDELADKPVKVYYGTEWEGGLLNWELAGIRPYIPEMSCGEPLSNMAQAFIDSCASRKCECSGAVFSQNVVRILQDMYKKGNVQCRE